MRDPYATLGLDPSASVADAEASFRRLLKQHHPDHHAGAAPEELAEAERLTRELTAAIAAIRAGWSASEPAGAWGSRVGASARGGAGWAGERSRGETPEPVACPFCSQPFWVLDHFDAHLRDAHPIHPQRRPATRADAVGRWVRSLPVPSLSLLVLLVLYWKLLFAVAPAPVVLPGFWVGVFGFLLLLTLAQLTRGRRYQSRHWRLD